MVKGSELSVDKEKCVGCGVCADAFPELFEIKDEKSHVISDGECDCDMDQVKSICPNGAISKKES
ncbi:MAG: ferredoxin [Patescibacteria group bacterium]|jgi:ferredoxin